MQLNRGFTLIEVLVAMVILSFAMVAVIQSFTTVSNNTINLRRHHIAYWVGNNYLAIQRLGSTTSTKSITSSVTEMAGKKWYVDAQVVPTIFPLIEKVLVQVFDQQADKIPVATVNGYRAK